jgi:hypothetical protein
MGVSARSGARPAVNLARWAFPIAFALGLCRSVLAGDDQQTGPVAPKEEIPHAATVEEVVVTGTRIKRNTDFTTPTPTTVIDAATVENMGLVNVGQAATLAPANVSTFTPANTGNSNFFTGAYIANLRGLNPYFGSRTLVLIDAERAVQTEQGDQFDLNFLPQILVSHIDTVTGGASAAYGSGAIDRITAGLDGKFGSSSWTWDAGFEYGVTHHSQVVTNTSSNYRIDMALDSVMTPNGPECRVTAVGFAAAVAANPFGGYASANPQLANGCLPLNPFGAGGNSAAALAYSFSDLVEQLRYAQTDFSVNMQGEYFSGVGAGPWSLAVGYEWRQERGDNTDQPGQAGYLASDYQIQYGSSFGGIVTVNEEYLETNMPLLKDKPAAHLLEFDIAGRMSQYQNRALYGVDVCDTPGVGGCPAGAAPAGTNFNSSFPTWKFSGIYEP